jgi:protein-S-isoprenylcysteine O-methyltransferase Ste14
MTPIVGFVSTPLRAVVAITAIGSAFVWLTGFLRPLDVSLRLELPAWVLLPGTVAIVVGGALVLWCGALLSRCGLGTLKGEEWFMPQEFVATGPFRYVRNPMSLGAMVLFVGTALFHRSCLCLGVAAAMFGVFQFVIVCMEEPGLNKRFGDSYREYCRNVSRWVPRLTPWQSPRSGEGAVAD